jgi:putative membrane protein
MPRHFKLLGATLLLFALLLLSGLRPYDRATWLMEVAPIFIALPILALTYQRFPLTTFLYVLIFVHAVILMAGGAYSYARVPLGFLLEKWLALHRNPYDKIGHFAQGLVPALLAREVLVRTRQVGRGWVLNAIVVCIALAFSATYEMVEWLAAVRLGQGADAFLGTQGDPWDTQSDMLFALIGGVTGVLLLAPLQDRQIQRLDPVP